MPRGIYTRQLKLVEEYFWPKVNKNGPIHPEHGQCWLWTAAIFKSSSYGQFCNKKSKENLAHRVSWTIYYGEIPEGLLVCHKCDVKLCVNPKHLFLGTYQDNTDDRDAKGRGKFPGANNPAKGDRNGSRTHPERLAWGDANWSRKHPECRQGENNGRVILTEDQVKEIRFRYSTKRISQEALAKSYGVSPSQIFRIVHQQQWKNLK